MDGSMLCVMRLKSLFAVRDVDDLIAETEEEGESLRKTIGAFGLTAMGVGAIIGTGIFVVIGQGVALAGPSLVLAFILAAITCLFSALSYAELASAVPVSGSAYTFSYATMGEMVAFIIGWDLILEYGVSVAAVAVGWGGNVNEFLLAAFGYDVARRDQQIPLRRRRVQPARGLHRPGDHRPAGPGHEGERRRQRGHGRDQDRHPAVLHHRRLHRVQQ